MAQPYITQLQEENRKLKRYAKAAREWYVAMERVENTRYKKDAYDYAEKCHTEMQAALAEALPLFE